MEEDYKKWPAPLRKAMIGLRKASGCGANAQGGGGFQKGNSCASGGDGGAPGDLSKQTETKEFGDWFGDSRVVDENDVPMVVYHGTDKDFSEFKVLSHFGTEQAANERLEDTGRGEKKMAVFLRIEKPLEIADIGVHSTPLLASEVDSRAGVSTFDEVFELWEESVSDDDREYLNGQLESWGYDSLQDAVLSDSSMYFLFRGGDPRDGSPIGDHSAGSDVIADTLLNDGFDGISYRNDIEDAGSTSWMVLSPDSVKSATNNSGGFDSSNPDITKSF